MEHQNKHDQWKGIIGEWHDSGLSQRKYCLKQTLLYSTFRYWYQKLGFGNLSAKVDNRISVVDVSRLAMKSRAIARNTAAKDVVIDKIAIAIPGTEATVTISGRMSLDSLSRIMSALNGSSDHAWT